MHLSSASPYSPPEFIMCSSFASCARAVPEALARTIAHASDKFPIVLFIASPFVSRIGRVEARRSATAPSANSRCSSLFGQQPDAVRVPGQPDWRILGETLARAADIGGEGAAAIGLD